MLWWRQLSLALLAVLTCFDTVESFAFVGNKSKIRFPSSITRGTRTTPLEFAASDDALCGLSIPSGLKEMLISNAHDSFSKRIWIVDNSGSMKMWDGHLVLNRDNECRRWDELKETVSCHAQLSAALGAPTEFRLLNPSAGRKSFRAGYGSRIQRDSKRAQAIMAKSQPAGMTPLHERIHDIRREVIRMLPQLNRDDSKVAIIVCTDGCNNDASNLPSLDQAEMNQEFFQALESLQGLPVWVVIRLCTDFGPVLEYYKSLNERLDLKVNVLDDHVAEASEVNRYNKWLNYALVLHRIREMGQCDPLFDSLSERALTKDEIRSFCALLFGPDKFPDPMCGEDDWASFCQQVHEVQLAERMHWNPRTKELSPWIDLDELELADCIDLDEFTEESL